MRKVVAIAVVLGLSAMVGVARADDKKADPSGTWKWEVERNGNKVAVTLKLKMDGDKLTGSMPGRQGNETAIEEASFKDDTVSFKVTRERNGQKTTTKYTGKIEGDTMKLKIEREGGNRAQEVEAKRDK
jgi:hypothetical protein